MKSGSRPRKVIIIGIDGMRADAMLVARTPNIDRLARNGLYSWKAQTELKTVSGPAWTSLLTGVHMDKHMVDDNEDMDVKRKVPTIISIIKDWNAEYRLAAHSHWRPIITHIMETDLLDIRSSGPDKKMAKRAARDIQQGKADFIFVQLDDIDAAGHMFTYSPRSKLYLRKIEKIDKLVGIILNALEKRSELDDWLACLVSDHGGNGKSHGGITAGELTIPFIISGDAIKDKGKIPGNEENSPRIVDVVPTIAKFLNIPSKTYWDGVPRGI
ncbi:MAG: alkaline phosphatase family protein [Promethearchaeota archaeon]